MCRVHYLLQGLMGLLRVSMLIWGLFVFALLVFNCAVFIYFSCELPWYPSWVRERVLVHNYSDLFVLFSHLNSKWHLSSSNWSFQILNFLNSKHWCLTTTGNKITGLKYFTSNLFSLHFFHVPLLIHQLQLAIYLYCYKWWQYKS